MTDEVMDAVWEPSSQVDIRADEERRKELLEQARRRSAARAYSARAAAKRRMDKLVLRLLGCSTTFFLAVCVLDRWLR